MLKEKEEKMDIKKKGLGIFIAAILVISVFAVMPVIAVNPKNSAPSSSHPTSGDSVYQGLLRIGMSDYGELLFWNTTEEAGLEELDGYCCVECASCT
jgi:hypothetical protein